MTRKAAIIGGGVIGGGWAARFLLNGWDVGVFDPDPEAERKINAVLSNARLALPALSDVPAVVAPLLREQLEDRRADRHREDLLLLHLLGFRFVRSHDQLHAGAQEM